MFPETLAELQARPDPGEIQCKTTDGAFSRESFDTRTVLGLGAGPENTDSARIGTNQPSQLRAVIDPLLHLLIQLGQEHALQGEKLCFLLRSEVIEIGVVYNIQAAVELRLILVMAFGLFPKFEEGFLYLNIG